ncbi:MAG: hypothetical protein LN545_00570 [Candidatus Megaira endosymbiont of Carteria cerasiformis]|nr:hypothetical protein [Candidatus Megaera polyxenophila]MCC8460494.1 hypothetical protein [Candidatus Megaera polyxenophila]
MSKTKEDNWENILKGHFNDEVYKKFRKLYPDDFLDKAFNRCKEDLALDKQTFIKCYTSPSGEWLYAPDLPNYMGKNFVCDKNFDPLADGSTIFPGTGKPFQIFRAQKPTNEWEKLFPNFIVKDSDTRSIISNYDVIKSTMSKIVGSLIPGILKNIKNLIEKGVTMKGVSPDLQKQTVNLIIYSADHEKNKEAADLLKLFLGNQTFKEALEPSCLTKLIARESAITGLDLSSAEIVIIGEHSSETNDSV